MSIQHDVLTEPTVDQGGPVGERREAAEGFQLPPLTVSALMVTKADLIAALRAYLPHLADIEVIDGDRFLLTVGAEHPETNGVTHG